MPDIDRTGLALACCSGAYAEGGARTAVVLDGADGIGAVVRD